MRTPALLLCNKGWVWHQWPRLVRIESANDNYTAPWSGRQFMVLELRFVEDIFTKDY